MEQINDKNYERLRSRIEEQINWLSIERGSDTPDYILSEYLIDCLKAFDKALQAREKVKK